MSLFNPEVHKEIIHICNGIAILVASVKMYDKQGKEDIMHAYEIVNTINGAIYDKFYRKSSEPEAFFRHISFNKKEYILTNAKPEYITLINLSDNVSISRGINIMGKRAHPIKCEKVEINNDYVAISMRCSMVDEPGIKTLDGGSNVKVITITIDDMDNFKLPDNIIIEEDK